METQKRKATSDKTPGKVKAKLNGANGKEPKKPRNKPRTPKQVELVQVQFPLGKDYHGIFTKKGKTSEIAICEGPLNNSTKSRRSRYSVMSNVAAFVPMDVFLKAAAWVEAHQVEATVTRRSASGAS